MSRTLPNVRLLMAREALGLQHYNEGLKPLKDYKKYKIVIQELACGLKTQKILLRNTCRILLTDIVESESEIACLLDDPKSDAWREEKLAHQLQNRLQESYTTYTELINGLSDAVGTLTNKIGLDHQGQPQWVDARSRKQYCKGFTACLLRKEHEALLSRMARDNQSLRNLTNDSLQFEISKSRPRNKLKQSSKEIRDQAAHLHNALQSCLSCSCSATHHAYLRLEQRDWTQPPCFRVTFPVSTASQESLSIWHEADIRVSGEVKARKDSHAEALDRSMFQNSLCVPLQTLRTKEKKKVSWAAVVPGVQAASMRFTDPGNETSVNEARSDSLCSVLCCSRDGPPRPCLGGPSLGHDRSHYEVSTLSKNHHSGTQSLNLHEILDRNQCPPMTSAIGSSCTRLTRRARLQLAVILASTILQLHTTPWLESNWSGNHIQFYGGSLDHPYVSKAFAEPGRATAGEVCEQFCGPIRNRSLFGLGVLLLELAEKKPLDTYKNREQPVPFEDFIIASQRLQNLADEEGPGYVEAAQACIFCNFGSKAKELDLDNDSFRQAVYEDVILPLERELEYFCGRA
ncbi:MAG: hypothetical protein Q9201_003906 [Fulgogasparrea decipioides]